MLIRWILSISVLLIVAGGIGTATLGCIQAIKGIHAGGSPGVVAGVVGAALIFLGTIAMVVLFKLKFLAFSSKK